jgi:hypothetical protein
MCGASTLGHGVLGTMVSGLVAAASMLGTSVEALLRPGEGQVRCWPADEPSAWPAEVGAQTARRQARHGGATHELG